MAKTTKTTKTTETTASEPAAGPAKPLGKAAFAGALASAATGAEIPLRPRQAAALLALLADLAAAELRRAGAVTLPGVARFRAVAKPAVAGGAQVENPFKPGEMMTTKARPATTKVRASAARALRAAVAAG